MSDKPWRIALGIPVQTAFWSIEDADHLSEPLKQWTEVCKDYKLSITY